MTIKYYFQVRELKNVVFFAKFRFFGPNFPVKSFKQCPEILQEGSYINEELPFQIFWESNHFSAHNELKTIYFLLLGPFLGTFGYPKKDPPS